MFCIKIGQVFFPEVLFLVHPILTNFLQRKRKMHDANDLLALSLVSIILHIHSFGKTFYCTYLKTTA